jgi:asparagine synthase (glutamine-hydrolysing)
MCGIAGIVRPRAERDRIAADLESMWPGIASRGPDGRGQLAQPGVGLLHSRLAIIDLATGDQPIWNERRTVACVFNGEIYNYRQLRTRLRQRGHRLATTSDTEVLVHLYEDHGDDLVEHVHGMFAFALWDAERRRVVVARDRLGIKPLYWAQLPEGGLAFASTLRSVVDVGVPPDPDFAALAEYFRFARIGEPRTAYSRIHALLPGFRMIVDADGAIQRHERFWHLPTWSAPRRGRSDSRISDDLEAGARRAFEGAVESHLVADVEVGAFLSGGIDSTLVVAQAQRLSRRPIRTFAVDFDGDPKFSEVAFAESVARSLGTNHTTLRVSAPAPELVRAALAAAHQPFAVASFLPLLLLCEQAAREVKVVLTGDGGDEVGFGYPWYGWSRRADRVPRSSVIAFGQMLRSLERTASVTDKANTLRRALKFLRGATLGGARGSDAWRYELTRDEALGLLAPEHRAAVGPEDALSPTELAWEPSLSDVEAMRRADLVVLLRDEMLPKLDRAGMAHGLEGRVPLLDDAFVDAMIDVPSEQHLAHPQGKALLRRWARELCPAVDVVRPKHGFDVPIRDWLTTSLYPDARRLLLERRRPGLVDPAAARALWTRMTRGVPGGAHAVYSVLMAELWFESRSGRAG